jgi:hypothetical protein
MAMVGADLGTAARSAPDRAASASEQHLRISETGWKVLVLLLLSTIFLQRFAIPLGTFGVPLILPLGLAVAGFLVVRGDVVPTGPRLVGFLAAAGALAATGYAASRYSTEVHLTSLVVVLSIWSLWILRARGSAAQNVAAFRRAGRVFVGVMTGLAFVGAVQLGSQFVGLWRYRDIIGEAVPGGFILPGYNTSIPIAWDSPINKAQAFFFLEPSTYSQFTAVAIIVAILLGARLWQLAVLGVGLLSALSGTGLMLLAVGLVLVLFRAPRTIRPAYLVAGVIALAAALATPASGILFDRADELDSQTSSLALRFVLPYEEVAGGMAQDPRRWVSGSGPGASDRLLESGRERAGLFVVYTLPAKLLFEYGLLASLVFLAYLGLGLFRGPPTVVLPGATLFWLFFLGGYLASPHVVWAAWLLVPVWSRHE